MGSLCQTALFSSVEVVDEREDETADRANEHQPIKKLHYASPPSFEEESRAALKAAEQFDYRFATPTLSPSSNATYVQKLFKRFIVGVDNFVLDRALNYLLNYKRKRAAYSSKSKRLVQKPSVEAIVNPSTAFVKGVI